MAIKNSDAFLDDIIANLQDMKEDPEKDTVARVVAMVFRTARKHNDHSQLRRSFLLAAMSMDGLDPYEYDLLQKWDEDNV